MLLSDSYLFDAGWLFFMVWSVVVAVVSITAFGRDLIPFRSPSSNPRKLQKPEIDKIKKSPHQRKRKTWVPHFSRALCARSGDFRAERNRGIGFLDSRFSPLSTVPHVISNLDPATQSADHRPSGCGGLRVAQALRSQNSDC